ncbi:Clp protease N-terminal domain-containing protein [Actinoalloteichus caeruleus]|uniref:Clp amino terminal domain-containing protein, pathogenicity island component n=1 Tax=Actinoalloteichus caeruleus DSM 43889 TaxID=1120930 RepID=A0ABT1JDH9_ACTCY|nr:Clp protease N-terminal domain-containing protein [Actinoalloteichus caeruleus]MCP2330549.1 Clp amino terminal domain-containing protein, pathogenicity island component [Actinoalloteichus caeruleus DSM 43889]
MPKINVYLPDDLADGVKATGVPVSAICQRALEQSVRRVSSIRATVLGDLEANDPTAELSQFTERTRTAIKLGIEQARESRTASVGTEHLLNGMLTEGTNLALHVLHAMEVDPAHVGRALANASPAPESSETPAATQFSGPAANALELTVIEALGLGHNYVGCEHLLLGLISESDGTAGHVLRELGIDLRSTRRTVVAALTGYTHLRAQTSTTSPADAATMIATMVRQELRPIVDRIERLEQQTGLTAEEG